MRTIQDVRLKRNCTASSPACPAVYGIDSFLDIVTELNSAEKDLAQNTATLRDNVRKAVEDFCSERKGISQSAVDDMLTQLNM